MTLSPPSLASVRALFVSPHLDDVALSCGGTVARSSDAGERPLIVTVFSGRPSPEAPLGDAARTLHEKWRLQERSGAEVVALRQAEDAEAARALGADCQWLEHLDAIYRGGYALTALRGPVAARDEELGRVIADELIALWRDTAQARVHLPLGVGEVVDHALCHDAGAALEAAGAAVLYYEDFPYAAETSDAVAARLRRVGKSLHSSSLAIDAQLERRVAAVGCYASQNPMVFRKHGGFEETIRRYAAAIAAPPSRYGERLWSRRPIPDEKR